MCLSKVLDDFSGDIIAWRRFSNIQADDMRDMLDMKPATSGCDFAMVQHKPRLLSNNDSSIIADKLAIISKTTTRPTIH
jgi:putative transposase